MLLNLFLRELRHSILFQSIFVVYTLARFPLLIGARRYQSRIVLAQEMRRADDSCFTNLKVRALISLDCNNPPQPAFKFCILLRKLVKRAHQAIISPSSAPGNATMVMLSHGVKIQQRELQSLILSRRLQKRTQFFWLLSSSLNSNCQNQLSDESDDRDRLPSFVFVPSFVHVVYSRRISLKIDVQGFFS